MNYKQYLSDLGLECPPDFDPWESCICCSLSFDKKSDLERHVKKKHPDFYNSWKKIVDSWDEEC